MSWKRLMETTDWLRQKPDQPLFPDLLWSRPENKRHAGKLLIVGGHKQSFNALSEAYSAALKAGIGTARVILPDTLQKTLQTAFPEAEYAASTSIGSLSRQALGGLLDGAEWADAILLAGDFGRNSETAILLESLVDKYSGKLALSGDANDYFLNQPSKIAGREDTLITGSLAQIQKLASPTLIQQNADLMKSVTQIKDWQLKIKANIITEQSDKVIVASSGKVSTTPVKGPLSNPELASYATVWWLQQPEKTFEALTTAVYCL